MSNRTEITAEQFEKATGVPPINDDLERANCPDAGKVGHTGCGWDHEHNLPNTMTMHLKNNGPQK